MEEKLITLAIHTFEKAQILKTLLETEGIDVYIHNVNQIQPVISAGVRVRIKESDLPHALRIMEDNNWMNEEDKKNERAAVPSQKRILIPIDFSDYSLKACEIGINYAHEEKSEVMLLHAYFSPYFPSTFPLLDADYYAQDKETAKVILKKAKEEMNKLVSLLTKKMEEGELPNVPFDFTIKEGLPEEEVLAFSKTYNPSLIIMGTRGKSKKDIDLIGSITGEVIETSRIPVLAIPENIPFSDLNEAKEIAFATSYNQRDLVIFDQLIELFKHLKKVNIHIFNVSTTHNELNEIRLAGLNEYFNNQYPDINITHTVLDDGDLMLAVEKFVHEKNIDLIALSVYKRGIFARMFYPSKARKMLFHTNTPLLTLTT